MMDKKDKFKLLAVFGILVFSTILIFQFIKPHETDNFSKYISSEDKSYTVKSTSKIDVSLEDDEHAKMRAPSSKRGEGVRARPGLRRLAPQQPISNLRARNNKDDVDNEPEDSLEVNGTKYHRLIDTFAIEDNYIPLDFEITGEINGYKIVKYNGQGEPPKLALTVLKDPATERRAVFTGILRIKFYDLADIDFILSKMNEVLPSDSQIELLIDENMEGIKVQQFQFESYEDTISVFNNISSKVYPKVIERVSIDLIQWTRKTN